jgi:hypothetical protein
MTFTAAQQYETVTVILNYPGASQYWQACIAGPSVAQVCNNQNEQSFTMSVPYGSDLTYACTAPNFNGNDGGYSPTGFTGSINGGACGSVGPDYVYGSQTIYANYGSDFYATCVNSAGTDTCSPYSQSPTGYAGYYYETDASSSECGTGIQQIFTTCTVSGGSYQWYGPNYYSQANFADYGSEVSSDSCTGYNYADNC